MLLRPSVSVCNREGVTYASHLIFRMSDHLNKAPVRLTDQVEMENSRDWLSRLLEMMMRAGHRVVIPT
jgi:hypothetical protein